MAVRVYNTLTRQKEDFVPRAGNKVAIYVCGVTPYNFCHVGNARPYVVWDVLRRYLEYKGFEVFHVQNFTDVDDKILAAAAKEGVGPREISDRYIGEFFTDMDALNVKRAHIYPRVTDHIDDIIAMVQGLVDKGFAYVVDGDVYYDVSQFAQYGKLSGRTLEEMRAGARVEVDERKANPMDFALWKAAKEGEQAWESPWGMGRPGWHIECSAMSHRYLGDGFDFHGGGVDLIFPHHENEIAQAEAYTGQPFVRYWLHNGFVNFSGEKMAKSVGNVVTIRAACEKYSGQALRLYLLSTHYRSPIDFDLEKLAAAQKGLERLTNAWATLEQVVEREETVSVPPIEQLSSKQQAFLDQVDGALAKFEQAMDDDFNSALAVGILFDLTREINTFLREPLTEPEGKAVLRRAYEVFATISDVLGLTGVAEAGGAQDNLVDDLIDLIIGIRQEARQRKDFATADAIRDQLGQLGIVLEDTPQGIRYRRK